MSTQIDIRGSKPGPTRYVVETSAPLQPTAYVNAEDVLSGSSAEGTVFKGTDRFVTEGEIKRIAVRDPSDAQVFVDGEPVQPQKLGPGLPELKKKIKEAGTAATLALAGAAVFLLVALLSWLTD